MKTLLLLAFIVTVCDFLNVKRKIGEEMVVELTPMAKMKSWKNSQGNEIFLRDLKMQYKNCEPISEYFCQVERELKKLSGLSGPSFEYFRMDSKLMRNLHMYHSVNCSAVGEGDEIHVHEFLKDFLSCVKEVNSKNTN